MSSGFQQLRNLDHSVSTFLRWANKSGVNSYNEDLCINCWIIFHNWCRRDNWTNPRVSVSAAASHHSIEALEASMKGGCPICKLLYQSLSSELLHTLDNTQQKERSKVYICPITADGLYQVELTFPFSELTGIGDVAQILLHECDAQAYLSDLDPSEEPHEVALETDSEECWALAAQWLKKCCSEHQGCAKEYTDRVLPRRLIDVGSKDEEIRLVETAELLTSIQYLTLSHCWGGLKFKNLTTTNYASLLKCISVKDGFLTKTFREAIHAVRRLGFRYIWIDSLCIIQDSLDDWKEQSSVMGRIYGGSVLNLAAMAAVDGNGGCFFTRDAKPVARHKVWFWAGGTEDNALWHRAWVYQETVLAPRTLYFARSQLLWACRDLGACEAFPLSVGSCYGRNAKILASMADRHLYSCWGEVISSYSHRQLSFGKDKLIALSGISRIFAAHFKASYIAGLWKEDIAKHLLWYTMGNLQQRPEEYQAPSWSWAALQSAASYALAEYEVVTSDLLVIEDVSVQLSTSDEYGQVSDGFLRITCRAPIRGLALYPKAPIYAADEPNWFTVDVGSEKFPLLLYPDTADIRLEEEYFYLPVIETKQSRLRTAVERSAEILMSKAMDNMFGDLQMHGIILRCISCGKFARVGYFEIWGRNWYGSVEEKFKALWMKPRDNSIWNRERSRNVEQDDVRDLGNPTARDKQGCAFYNITIV
ncbi:heterokaryon incompatibility protein [Rutstroemia sp. NJR-2017a BBW]|nr:heterokaryon incompatibility protein [Rutstroemia sp. NJR-2017a BBW]